MLMGPGSNKLHKTCKGQEVVNSLLTPASEAVLSVPVGMQMPCTPCPSQDHAIRMSASWAKVSKHAM